LDFKKEWSFSAGSNRYDSGPGISFQNALHRHRIKSPKELRSFS
jgi:hypothetical protein